jgi:hypothetical protein
VLLDDLGYENYYSKQVIPSRLITPIDGLLPQNHGEGGSNFVQHRPQKSFGVPVERFLASLRFEHRSKLDQLGIEIGSLD